jgi:G3E family GTPase
MEPIPVTILTGFLGSGKTTLLKRILEERHGERIAVIENEFGEEGIDNELLVQDTDEQIVEMNNGCICCTVRGDLVRILGELHERRRRSKLSFDRVVIETTGLADPAPVAQTFFVEDGVRERYRLDSIVTLVDAVHGWRQLDEHHEAQEQVGFADRILLSKTDLADEAGVEKLVERIGRMNPRAPVKRVHFGRTELRELLDIRGFDLDAILDLDPRFLEDSSHEHDDDVSSFAIRTTRPFDMDKLEAFMDGVLRLYGQDLLRYKGVLHCRGQPHRIVFQGVHMMMGGSEGRRWRPGERRESRLVFIGRRLPRELFERGLALCHADDEAGAAEPR